MSDPARQRVASYSGCLRAGEFERLIERQQVTPSKDHVALLRAVMVRGEKLAPMLRGRDDRATVYRLAKDLYEKATPMGWERRVVCLPQGAWWVVNKMEGEARARLAEKNDAGAN